MNGAILKNTIFYSHRTGYYFPLKRCTVFKNCMLTKLLVDEIA